MNKLLVVREDVTHLNLAATPSVHDHLLVQEIVCASARSANASVVGALYLDFDHNVPFQSGGEYPERSVLNEGGNVSGRAQAAVRPIPVDDFNRIVGLGLDTHDELLPRSDAEAAASVAEEQVPYEFEQDRVQMLTKRTIRDRIFRTRVLKAHIKSNTLSHLFAQGAVSAQCFRDKRFRAEARKKCLASHAPLFDGDPAPKDYEVVFAIMSTAPGDIRDALPFFSKQSLVNASHIIEGLGHPLCITKIPFEVAGA